MSNYSFVPKGRKGERKKKITVKYHRYNKDEIGFDRMVLSWFFVFIPILWPFALLGFGRYWKPWRLLNADLYRVEREMLEITDKLEDLNRKRLEIEEALKQRNKSINDSSRENVGESHQFEISVPVSQLSFKKQDWRGRPDGDWRRFLNPKMFPGLTNTKTPVRERLGVEESGRPSQRTAYVPSDFKDLRHAVGDAVGADSSVAYKEPQQKKQDNNNNRKNRRGSNHHNDNHHHDNGYDDD